MRVTAHVSISELTTFRVGGSAAFVYDCESVLDIVKAITDARKQNLPFFVLGEGSNVLPLDDGYPGIILRPRMREPMWRDVGETVVATIGAGYSWEQFVHDVASRELWGIENLAGIPGTVGAAPVQNIGAYGTEVAASLHEIEVFDTSTLTSRTFSKEACGFSYRGSLFRGNRTFIITSVTFVLQKRGQANLSYGEVKNAAQTKDVSSPGAVGTLIRSLRSSKFPDLSQEGTAGSFFKNPIISVDAFEHLKGVYAAVPGFPVAGGVKIPLAWLLDHVLSLRGYTKGGARLFERQPLIIVSKRGGSAHDIELLARDVEKRVHDTFDISIEREVLTLQ